MAQKYREDFVDIDDIDGSLKETKSRLDKLFRQYNCKGDGCTISGGKTKRRKYKRRTKNMMSSKKLK